jgi:NTE family protein
MISRSIPCRLSALASSVLCAACSFPPTAPPARAAAARPTPEAQTAATEAQRLTVGSEMDPWSGLLVSPRSRSAALADFLRHALAERRIEAFARRFVAVATARDSGELHAFGSGDAVCAVLASAALPGALAPVLIGGCEHVDDGIAQPLPVRAARALSAQR